MAALRDTATYRAGMAIVVHFYLFTLYKWRVTAGLALPVPLLPRSGPPVPAAPSGRQLFTSRRVRGRAAIQGATIALTAFFLRGEERLK